MSGVPGVGLAGPLRAELLRRADVNCRATIQRSGPSYASRMRTWIAFAGALAFSPLQPNVLDVLAFIGVFHNAFSAEKYVQAAKWMCTYAGRQVDVFSHPKVAQALRGAKKRTLRAGIRRQPEQIPWGLLVRLVGHAWIRKEYEVAVAYVLASMFLLRCQSELIPLLFDGEDTHSSISFCLSDSPSVSVFLKSRKNMPCGSRMTRKCMCPTWESIRPVHIFVRYLAITRRRAKGRVFKFSYASFTNILRAHLSHLGVLRAQFFTTKAFRRGTLQQMVKAGSSLGQILTAGQWNSTAFMVYLQNSDINEEAVFQALDDMSDDEAPPKRRRCV